MTPRPRIGWTAAVASLLAVSAPAGAAATFPSEPSAPAAAPLDRSPNIRQLRFAPTTMHLKDAVFHRDLLIASRYDKKGPKAYVNQDGGEIYAADRRHQDGLDIFRILPGPPYLKHLSTLDCRAFTEHASISAWRRWIFISVGDASDYHDEECRLPNAPLLDEVRYGADVYRGLLVLDIADPRRPQAVLHIPSSCVNATHTLIPHLARLYIYGGGHQTQSNSTNCNSALPGPTFDIEVIRFVPGDPPTAEVVARPRFEWTTGCHDVTVLPSKRLAACSNPPHETWLMDITDPTNPVAVSSVREPTGASVPALLSWDGRILLHNRATGWTMNSFESVHPITATAIPCGGDGASNDVGLAFYDLGPGTATFSGLFGLPRAAPAPCYPQYGNVVPMEQPDRDVVVMSWRKGGLSVIDFSHPSGPREIGHWLLPGTQVEAAYWYNGRIYLVEQGGTGTEEGIEDLTRDTLGQTDDRFTPFPGIRVLEMDGLGREQTRFFLDGYSNRSQIAAFER